MTRIRNSVRLFCAGLSIGLLLATAAYAQGKWTKLAPFPEPAEELLGVAAGGKMYVFCGLAPGWKPIGLVYEYDPAANTWAKKKPMPLLSHHVAFAEYRGKIYAFGGFVLPASGPAAWVPVDNAWEYDPVADSWKALAPLPTRRGSPVAAVAGDKIYVIGGAAARLQGTGGASGAPACVGGSRRRIRSRHQHLASASLDADAAQSRDRRRREREDLRGRRAGRGRIHHLGQ